MTGRYYTPEQIARVREGYERGESPREIAAAIGRSYKSVTVQGCRIRQGKCQPVRQPRQPRPYHKPSTPVGKPIFGWQAWITRGQDAAFAALVAGRSFA